MPSVTVTVFSLPPRSSVSSILSPGLAALTMFDHFFHPGDLLAVDLGDDVAAEADFGAFDRRLGVAAFDPGLVGGAALDDGWTSTPSSTGRLSALARSGVIVPPLMPR